MAMVAMVNHTAVASLHGDQHNIVASKLQEAGGGNGSLQERNITGDSSWVEPGSGEENATADPHQVDGPFVWETTVSWNNLTNQIYVFRNKAMCSVLTLLGTL